VGVVCGQGSLWWAGCARQSTSHDQNDHATTKRAAARLGGGGAGAGGGRAGRPAHGARHSWQAGRPGGTTMVNTPARSSTKRPRRSGPPCRSAIPQRARPGSPAAAFPARLVRRGAPAGALAAGAGGRAGPGSREAGQAGICFFRFICAPRYYLADELRTIPHALE
jgi:hypothetical protein